MFNDIDLFDIQKAHQNLSMSLTNVPSAKWTSEKWKATKVSQMTNCFPLELILKEREARERRQSWLKIKFSRFLYETLDITFHSHSRCSRVDVRNKLIYGVRFSKASLALFIHIIIRHEERLSALLVLRYFIRWIITMKFDFERKARVHP